jgi:hypothetical protein
MGTPSTVPFLVKLIGRLINKAAEARDERDAWKRLYYRLNAAIAEHQAKIEGIESLKEIDHIDAALYAVHARTLLAQLPPNEENDRADDQEDDQQRGKVGMTDRGEHGTPPVEEPSAPAPAESGDAEAESDETSEKWRKLDEDLDAALWTLLRRVAMLAVFLPDLPARHCQLIDDVLATIDHWAHAR